MSIDGEDMSLQNRYRFLRTKGLTSFEALLLMVAEVFPQVRDNLARTASIIEEIHLLFYEDHTGYKINKIETEIGTFITRERNKKRVPYYKKTTLEEERDSELKKEKKELPMQKRATRPSYEFVERRRLAESLTNVKISFPFGIVEGWDYETWAKTDEQQKFLDSKLSRSDQNKYVKEIFLRDIDLNNTQKIQHFAPRNLAEEEFMSIVYGSYLSVPAPISAYLSGVFAYYLSMLHLDRLNSSNIIDHFRNNKAIGLIQFLIKKGLVPEDPVIRNGRLFRAKFSGIILCLFYSYNMLETEMINGSKLSHDITKEKCFRFFSDPSLKIVGSVPLSKSAMFIKDKKITAKYMVGDAEHVAEQLEGYSTMPCIPIYDPLIMAEEQEAVKKIGCTTILKYIKGEVFDRGAALSLLIDPRIHTKDDSWPNFAGIPGTTIEEGNFTRIDFSCKPYLIEYLDKIYAELYPLLTFRAVAQAIMKAGGPNSSSMGPIKIGSNKITKEDVQSGSKAARLAIHTTEIVSSLYGNPKIFTDLSTKNTEGTWRAFEIPVDLRKNFLYFKDELGKKYKNIRLPRYKVVDGILVDNPLALGDYENCGMVSKVVIRNVPGKAPRVAIGISLDALVANAFGVMTNMIQKHKDFRYEIGTGNASSNPLDTILTSLSEDVVSIGYDAEAFDQHAGNGFSLVMVDKMLEKISQTQDQVLCDKYPNATTLRAALAKSLVKITKDGLIWDESNDIIGVAIHPLASSVVYALLRMKMFYAKPVNKSFNLMLSGLAFPGSEKLSPLVAIGSQAGYFVRLNFEGVDTILACISNGAVPSGELNTLSYNSIIERSVGMDMAKELEKQKKMRLRGLNVTGDDLLLMMLLFSKQFNVSEIAQIGVDVFHRNGFKSARDKQEMIASFYIKNLSAVTDISFPPIPHFSQEREPTGISAIDNLLVKADKIVLNTAAGLNDPMGSMLMLASALWIGWDEVNTENRDVEVSLKIPLSTIFLPPSLGGLGIGLYSTSFKKSIDFLTCPPQTQEDVDWYSRGRTYAVALATASNKVEKFFLLKKDFNVKAMTGLKLNYRMALRNIESARAIDPLLTILRTATDKEFESVFMGTVHRLKYQVIRRVERDLKIVRMDELFTSLREKIVYTHYTMAFKNYYPALEPTSSFLAKVYSKTGLATSTNKMINLIELMSDATGISVNDLYKSFIRASYDNKFATIFSNELLSLGVTPNEIGDVTTSFNLSDLLSSQIQDAWTNKSQSLINQKSMALRVKVTFKDGLEVDTYKGFNPFILYMLHLIGTNDEVGAIDVKVDMNVQEFLSFM